MQRKVHVCPCLPEELPWEHPARDKLRTERLLQRDDLLNTGAWSEQPPCSLLKYPGSAANNVFILSSLEIKLESIKEKATFSR